MSRRVVVAGAGLAGAVTATTLRELGFDGSIDVVGEEAELPYERPALSKGFLAGKAERDELRMSSAAEYDGFGIRMHLSVRAVGVDLTARVVHLADGGRVPYDDLVVATGSVNRRLDVPGADLDGVHQLRTLADAEALRIAADAATRAVVVGQGFVGCEVAATLRRRGLDVTMVDPQPGPLHGVLGSQVSERVAGWHRDEGVQLRNDVGTTTFAGGSRVEAVRLADGSELPADLVVVGVGARPATDWLVGSGLAMERGAVLVDGTGRSSAEGVFAAGDASAWWDDELGRHVHVEHYDSAVVQGQRVAHAIVGSSAGARGRSWFWSDQYDHTLHYCGTHEPGDDLLWRGGTGFWLRDGAVSAVVALDDGRTFRRAMTLVGTRQEVRPLLDAEVDLRSLRPSA